MDKDQATYDMMTSKELIHEFILNLKVLATVFQNDMPDPETTDPMVCLEWAVDFFDTVLHTNEKIMAKNMRIVQALAKTLTV